MRHLRFDESVTDGRTNKQTNFDFLKLESSNPWVLNYMLLGCEHIKKKYETHCNDSLWCMRCLVGRLGGVLGAPCPVPGTFGPSLARQECLYTAAPAPTNAQKSGPK